MIQGQKYSVTETVILGVTAKDPGYFCHAAIPRQITVILEEKNMKVAVLNYNGAVASSVAGPADMLIGAGQVSQAMHIPGRELFEVSILNSPHVQAFLPGNMIGNKRITDTADQYDLIIIPAMHFNCIQQCLQSEPELAVWIKDQYNGGASIGSICIGAFLLAHTGILDGRRATTHWMGAEMFRQFYPQVMLESDKVIIDEGQVYTCGAAYSFTTFMIYLIEKYCGRDLALAVSKVFMINLHDTGQNTFAIFNLQHHHGDKEVVAIQQYMEKNYQERPTIAWLAEKFHLSQRTLIRRFTAATGNTPLEYMQRVKVEAAKRMLEDGKLTVEEICQRCGYEDFNSFRAVFRRSTGITLKAYKQKYARMFSQVNIS